MLTSLNLMKMNGQQLRRFSEILRAAFPLPRFDQLLLYRLDIRRADIALGNTYEEIVFNVFTDSQSRNWTFKLLQAARESNPDDPDLFAFAQQFGLSTATPGHSELERLIDETNVSFDVVRWRTLSGHIETQVCRIEVSTSEGVVYGTGFLVGPGIVITNYHVMEEVIDKNCSPREVVLRFDYKRLADGTTINPGTVYRLAEDWLVDFSKYSSVDEMIDPTDPPETDELDYALLRLDAEPGNEPIGHGASDPDASLRKWIEVPVERYDFKPQTPLYIVQHPAAKPLQLALDTKAVIQVNNNYTRVRYKTNTEAGSSGAPCFNKDWTLVALHHSGDPNFARLHKPQYNQGIPIAAIAALLEQRGKKDTLGAPSDISLQ